MHKSHQTRLTGISNQINEQHANQMAVVKEEYETKVGMLEDTLKKLQEQAPNEEDIANQKAELLEKIEKLELLSAEDKTNYAKELSNLKKQSAAQLESLVSGHQEELENATKSLKVIFFTKKECHHSLKTLSRMK